VLIRQIIPSDTAEWLRMRLALWPEHSAEEHLQDMETVHADPTNAVFVAQRENGSLCGFLEAAQRKYADGCDTSRSDISRDGMWTRTSGSRASGHSSSRWPRPGCAAAGW
jgi:aminoglycoside 6'-N-acetyltransferase I